MEFMLTSIEEGYAIIVRRKRAIDDLALGAVSSIYYSNFNTPSILKSLGCTLLT